MEVLTVLDLLEEKSQLSDWTLDNSTSLTYHGLSAGSRGCLVSYIHISSLSLTGDTLAHTALTRDILIALEFSPCTSLTRLRDARRRIQHALLPFTARLVGIVARRMPLEEIS
jgi:hypothetical protein